MQAETFFGTYTPAQGGALPKNARTLYVNLAAVLDRTTRA